jgi:hypothetical protein
MVYHESTGATIGGFEMNGLRKNVIIQRLVFEPQLDEKVL